MATVATDWTEPLVRRLIKDHGGQDPHEIVTQYADRLRKQFKQRSLPVDVDLIASCLGIRRRTGDYDFAGRIYVEESGQLVMNLRASDSIERQRFTCAHELIHPAFPGFRDDARYRIDTQVGHNAKARAQEEYLCDYGAAELLMPRQLVEPAYSIARGLHDAERLSRDAEASLEAAANRLVDLADESAALLVFYVSHKPADQPALRRGEDVPERLRLRYCHARGIDLFAPRYKAAEDDSVFVRALTTDRIVRGTAPLPGYSRPLFKIEARAYPVAERQRVLAIARTVE